MHDVRIFPQTGCAGTKTMPLFAKLVWTLVVVIIESTRRLHVSSRAAAFSERGYEAEACSF